MISLWIFYDFQERADFIILCIQQTETLTTDFTTQFKLAYNFFILDDDGGKEVRHCVTFSVKVKINL